MLIGNAPVSWGVFEVESGGTQLPWQRVLDEIAATGYAGTELGPWGFLPTDPARLADELARRELRLASAFHPIEPLPDDVTVELRRADAVADTLARLGCDVIVLACAQTPDRAAVAGRVTLDEALDGADWQRFVDLVRRISENAAARGLRPCFHHHAATYVETPDEIARLLDAVDATTLALCLDTGHYAFGGGEPVDALERYGDRIGFVHLKDLRRVELADARDRGQSFMGAVAAGVFCELGQGDADAAAVVRRLHASGYSGWCIVEQDRVIGPEMPPDAPRRSAEISRDWLRSTLGI